MVFLVAGYPIPYPDANVWALRHWPDMDIYDDRLLPGIISRYHKSRGGNVGCIAVNIKDGPGLVCFFVIYSKHDPLSTPLKYRQFPEGKLALKCKELLFGHEEDEELANKVQFMTVADPYDEYYKFRPLPDELQRRRATSSKVTQVIEKHNS